MRKAILLAVFASCVAISGADAELISIENFDSGTPLWTNYIAGQLFQDPNSSDQGLFIQANSGSNANFSGNSLFGKDLLGETGEPTLTSPYFFNFDPIDTSGFTNVVLSFDYAVFANADVGSYEVFIDGVGQGSVEYYNDPDTTILTGSIVENIGIANTVGLVLSGTLNGSSDTLELDNFELNGPAAVPEPTSLVMVCLALLGLSNRRRRA